MQANLTAAWTFAIQRRGQLDVSVCVRGHVYGHLDAFSRKVAGACPHPSPRIRSLHRCVRVGVFVGVRRVLGRTVTHVCRRARVSWRARRVETPACIIACVLLLQILVHPNSGCETEDHSSWALWGGHAWELDMTIFSCEAPGCVPPPNSYGGY